ncbi:hypothetical protein Scep_022136 [Stephania cephalantha]|uniref:WD repeat and HMG-box DNA-binding protein 1 n=1 Tax=Stephania cephalantha TaxID=152367 RepID=A0AAP0F7G1_9MAGN
MKGRSLKLKEAHKSDKSNGAVGSVCSILWDVEAQHIITSSSSDSSILIHDTLLQSTPPKGLQHHRDGVTALALSPNSTCLASGSIDHSVKLYRFPDGEFQTNITRFTLPIRALAFNKSGSMLAAAGDDEGIKLINMIDDSIVRVLKGHKRPVTGLAFDPKGEYLVSVDSSGSLIFWELSSGKTLYTLNEVAPDYGSDTSVLNVLSWSPDGDLLAVPGFKSDVVMYDRDTAERLFSLKGEHDQSVCFLSWSPNGKYMATSGLDRQVLIWDVDKRQDIDRLKFDDTICSMSWKPHGNALAVIDTMGKFGVWESAVPSSMKSPSDGAPNLKSRTNGLHLFDEDEPNSSSSANLNEDDGDSHVEIEQVSRKRLRKQSALDALDEDSDDKANSLPEIEPRKKSSRNHKKHLANEGEEIQSIMKPRESKMQEAFQPGSTPVQTGKRRFLCYNMLGTITTIEQEGYSHIEVDFHDTGRGHRVPAMTDYFGFTMASLNENGSVFANPSKGEKHMSTLMYRPFSSWANNSEWSMRFEEEEVKVVALGTGWVAAATSLHFLRIFTEGGLQKNVVSLDGRVVTASGFKNKLAVVYHVSDSLPSNDQMLEFRVFNISDGSQPLQGRLPLTPGSSLSWFGFSEEGQLGSYDSKGVLRVFTEQYGGSWFPIFSANREKKSENYWIVGMNSTKLFCIVCKYPESYPLVIPKPVLTPVSLLVPLASSDLGEYGLENEFILNNLYIAQTHKKIENMATAGLDTVSLEDEAFDLEASLDKCILRLIAACCNADKLVRATELVRLLSMEKSVRGAIKLVTALKLPALAERFSGILEERLLNERMGTIAKASIIPNASLMNGVEVHSTSKVTDKVSEPVPALPSLKPTSYLSTEQEKSEGKVISKMGGKVDSNMNFDEANMKNGASKVKLDRNINPSPNTATTKIGKVSCEKNIKEGSDLGEIPRPQNPFAKATSNQKNSSIFDSIKKMKVNSGGRG